MKVPGTRSGVARAADGPWSLVTLRSARASRSPFANNSAYPGPRIRAEPLAHEARRNSPFDMDGSGHADTGRFGRSDSAAASSHRPTARIRHRPPHTRHVAGISKSGRLAGVADEVSASISHQRGPYEHRSPAARGVRRSRCPGPFLLFRTMPALEEITYEAGRARWPITSLLSPAYAREPHASGSTRPPGIVSWRHHGPCPRTPSPWVARDGGSGSGVGGDGDSALAVASEASNWRRYLSTAGGIRTHTSRGTAAFEAAVSTVPPPPRGRRV
jgi:hypothetical protein